MQGATRKLYEDDVKSNEEDEGAINLDDGGCNRYCKESATYLQGIGIAVTEGNQTDNVLDNATTSDASNENEGIPNKIKRCRRGKANVQSWVQTKIKRLKGKEYGRRKNEQGKIVFDIKKKSKKIKKRCD